MMKKFLFVHIAKTGGSSIRRMLNSSSPKINYDCIHNDKLLSFEKDEIKRRNLPNDFLTNNYELIAYFVRNPYERLMSCYKYFYNGGLNQFKTINHHGDSHIQESIKEYFPRFEDCCHNLNDFCKLVSHAKPMSSVNLLSNIILQPNKHNIFHGRFESFNEDIIKLFGLLGFSLKPKNILKINSSYSNYEYKYNLSMKKAVYKFYKKDFDNFNYKQ